ncbi:UDP-N-acetylmuramate--L-alanine ligase [Candidatus Wolfebacteria bacterium]|uniref:UDP-N-acetylmuramate--L-alanine ligase n=1 Tax=Candidatus Wolfebacteria bacterium CG_4_10_14_0_2_um_filter_39_18 TaxID=1975061 RepID=A0A2M7TFE5_9BACT|nr:UDP-N-acetylmuramate--L-alanine ligase [Candidatus Wolfebacteria bacterium]NCO44795.1 UDP-N-acetylmuramate--L-alanine ligase [Candidatus Wolfebacteria bacterium]PIZ44570.1 MAG: UDP-N-acetylmuramate--L-alanine ligase [Candidatus Wolfebacteria bacterium CG_4_10_14_0_2_um_filter_39_18]
MKPKIHFIGIGGIGTSALARWFLSKGYKVSGSDTSPSETTQELKKQGIKIFVGQKASNLDKNIDLVVHTAAVKAGNPEFKKARELKIPVMSYSQALGNLTKHYKTIAIAGTHGKSTTTALMSLVSIKAKLDPTVIVGTKLKEFGGSNFRPARRNFNGGGNGKGEYLIIEADEYANAFSNYYPWAAIILNIDREHLDFYKNLSEIKNAFLGFIGNVKPGGILILNKDDKNLFSLKNKIQKIAGRKKIKIHWFSVNKNLEKILQIIGRHNVSNASAVYDLAKMLGVKEKDIKSALKSFTGAWRRMEYRGLLKAKSYKLKAKVYDDYAHHPTEIKATLSGIAQKWPKRPLICVFQPHQTKRLTSLFKEFSGAFDDANALILLDIFKVRGRENVSQNVNSKTLAEAIKKRVSKFKIRNSKLKNIIYLPHSQQKNIKRVLKNILQVSSFKFQANVIMMGAGDIYHHTKRLLASSTRK